MDVTIAQEMRELVKYPGLFLPDQVPLEGPDRLDGASSAQSDGSDVAFGPEDQQSQQGAPATLQSAPPNANDGGSTTVETPAQESAQPGLPTPLSAGGTTILVRQDGRRPHRFTGVPLVSYQGLCKVGSWDCSQEVRLFRCRRSEGDTFLLVLSLVLPQSLGVRPVYDCFELEPDGLQGALDRWFRRVRARVPITLTATVHDTAVPKTDDLAAGFHAMTAHCFRTEQLPQTRNGICLQ